MPRTGHLVDRVAVQLNSTNGAWEKTDKCQCSAAYRVQTVTDIVEFCVVSRSANGDGCSAPMAMLMDIYPSHMMGWGVHPL